MSGFRTWMKPVVLSEWIANIPRAYRDTTGAVVALFIEDTISDLIGSFFPNENPPLKTVVSINNVLSIPVVRVVIEDGPTFVLRSDSVGWIVSVQSDCQIRADFHGLFDEDKVIKKEKVGEMDPEWVYGSYRDDSSKFTVELVNDFDLYTFIFLTLASYCKK